YGSATEEEALHKLLELAMAATGLGVGDDYPSKAIEFPLGGAFMESDSYYPKITVSDGSTEMDIDDEKTQKQLFDELKKRLLEFDKRIEKTRTELAEEIFNRPIKHIVDLDEDDGDE
ncbi:MAG: hypothetical protein DRN71_03275, partial [Candidatus Nanohalarchaeota archaeon]